MALELAIAGLVLTGGIVTLANVSDAPPLMLATAYMWHVMAFAIFLSVAF